MKWKMIYAATGVMPGLLWSVVMVVVEVLPDDCPYTKVVVLKPVRVDSVMVIATSQYTSLSMLGPDMPSNTWGAPSGLW